MKKIMYLLLLLPVCIAGCRKDPSEKKVSKADSYEGYIIQGKMKNVIATDGGIEQPFLMVFTSNNQAKLINLNGETTLSYSTQEGKLLLNDFGYFNIADKQITDWVIAGLNITQATLKPKPSTSQLKGKTFKGTLNYSKIQFPVDEKIQFDATVNQFFFPGEQQPEKYNFTLQGNVGGYLKDNASDAAIFFMYNNGNLEFLSYGNDVGITVATFTPM